MKLDDLKAALIKDYNELLVPQFTTTWEAERTIRALEIAQMPLTNLLEAFQQYQEEAIRETLGGLLELREQEVDLDGRPMGMPYYVITGENREVIEDQLTTLRKGTL